MRLFTCVSVHVGFEVVALTEASLTDLAFKWWDIEEVSMHVSPMVLY